MSYRTVLCLMAGIVSSQTAFAIDINDYRLVDLTHTFSRDTLYWPTAPSRFEKQELSFGQTEGGWFYSAFALCTPEHGGTHLDAPQHFAAEGMTTDQLPLRNLIAPAVVIDVSDEATADRNYRLSAADVLTFEAKHGRIEPGSIVLLHTGWSRYWPDAKEYLGDDTPGDASNLQFPSYGVEASSVAGRTAASRYIGCRYGFNRLWPIERLSRAPADREA